MNRLTEIVNGVAVSKERYEKYSPCHSCPWQSTDECKQDNCTYGSALDRLLIHEDKEEIRMNSGMALQKLLDAESNIIHTLREWKKYKGLEEQGLLIKSPCKVGDTIYAYCDVFHRVLDYFIEQIIIDYDTDANLITFNANCVENTELLDSIDFEVSEIGKTVFLTQEEAEKALEVPDAKV